MMDLNLQFTHAGLPKLVLSGRCSNRDEFPDRVQALANHFAMTVVEEIETPGVHLWITRRDGSEFNISWDIWTNKIVIRPHAGTSNQALLALLEPALI